MNMDLSTELRGKLLTELNRIGISGDGQDLALSAVIGSGRIKKDDCVYELCFGQDVDGTGNITLREQGNVRRKSYIEMMAGETNTPEAKRAEEESRKDAQRKQLRSCGKQYEAMLV